ncbi:MAG TPA: hypothetical protein VN802_12920 [Stellaceae bacterium]|nr:hypothetical protein [Stellaceae bacterium]
MLRFAVLTCVLGSAAVLLGACVYEPGPSYATYRSPTAPYVYASPTYSYGPAPYDEADPMALRHNEGALGGM